MWPRVIEICLGIWLSISPLIFGLADDQMPLWVTCFASGALVALFAFLSFNPSLRRMHFFSLIVAAVLAGFAVFAEGAPPAPPYQNFAVVALLLAMFAILPSMTNEPPRAWRAFYNEEV